MTNQNQDEFYFDDCPICQATKQAEKEGRSLSLSELTEVFDEANEMQEKGEEVGAEFVEGELTHGS